MYAVALQRYICTCMYIAFVCLFYHLKLGSDYGMHIKKSIHFRNYNMTPQKNDNSVLYTNYPCTRFPHCTEDVFYYCVHCYFLILSCNPNQMHMLHLTVIVLYFMVYQSYNYQHGGPIILSCWKVRAILCIVPCLTGSLVCTQQM